MVLREHNDPLNQSRGIMGPLENSAGVQNNRGRLRQRFDLIRKLGQGTYGKVQLGIDKETGQEVAIKTIKKSKIETDADLIRIRREIQIMSSVKHPNIIHIYEVFENREKMVLVMEYAAGGELYDYLNERKILQEDEARRIFRQVSSAVYYCHKHKICHRDLKLENILLDEKSNAKIADFGLSNVFNDTHLLKTFCGSPLYASPEIVRGTPYYGPEVDCWSLGVLLYTLVYGAMPFDGSNFKRLVKQISNGDYYEPKQKAEASSLIRLMLTVDPVKRASIKDVCDCEWVNFGFEEKCLQLAETLANQTPVRLDLLLSLAPDSSINHDNVVIEKAGTGDLASSSQSKPPPKASRLDEEGGRKKPKEPAKGVKTPTEVKRKVVVKKKSQSSPLLELIVDVEEEVEMVDDEAGDTLSEISEIQTIAEENGEVKAGKGNKVKVESAPTAKPKADALEKPKEKADRKSPARTAPEPLEKPKEKPDRKSPARAAPEALDKPKEKVDRKSPAKTAPEAIEKPKEKVDRKSPAKTAPEAPEKPKEKVERKSPARTAPEALEKPKEKVERRSPGRSAPPAPPAELKTAPAKVQKEPSPIKTVETKAPGPVKEEPPKPSKVEPAQQPKTAEPTKPSKADPILSKPEEVPKPSKPEPVIAKSKKEEPAKIAEIEPSKASSKVEENSKVPETPGLPEKPAEPVVKKTLVKRKVIKKVVSDADKAKEATESSSDNNSKAEPKPSTKPPLVKQRSGSLSNENTSPTRIERRSSKIISQKTAELIQNLETKSSTDGPRGKKLVFPSLKVSDAKSRFENNAATAENNGPPKLGPLKSQLSLEKKTVAELKPAPPAKSKSPSPKPSPVEATRPAESAVKVEPKPTKNEEPAAKLSEAAAPLDKTVTPVKPPAKPAAVPEVSPAVVQPVKDKDSPKPFPKAATELQPAPPKPAAPVKPPLKLKMPDTEIKPVIVHRSVPAPVNAPPLTTLESGTTTGLSTTDPFFSDTESVGPAKPKLLSKLPPQNKEQAAKKIGSVIQKIVSSESVPKLSRLDSFESGKTMRSEVSFPITGTVSKERMIPIKLVGEPETPGSSINSSATNLPRLPARMDSGRSVSSAYSRQNSSDTENSMATTAPHRQEPIKKSPREFIIPIKMEASGHTVAPKPEILNSESSAAEDDFRLDGRLRSGRFGKQRRYSSLLSDSSFEDEPLSASVSASTSRRSSAAATGPSHTRSLSQGDEPAPSSSGTFKRGSRIKMLSNPLDRSDSFSSAEEDEEDAFEVLTAESLFSSLLDRVRNLTKRLNKEDNSSAGPSWPASGPESPSFGLWNSGPLREFMASSAPLEAKQFLSYGPTGTGTQTVTRSYSREPSVTVTITSGPGWRRSLSRDVSGDSSDMSESRSIPVSISHNLRHRPSLGNSSDGYETCSVRSAPVGSRFNYGTQRSEPGSSDYATVPSRPPYGRTMSNTDYGNSVTLPFHRRSLRGYERTLTGSAEPDPIHSGRGMTPRLSNDPCRFEPSRFEPGSPYLARLQSLNRASATPEPDSRRFMPGRASLDSALRPLNSGNGTEHNTPNASAECNGWVGGCNSSSTKTTAASMTTQEKMNNYQNYYRSLSETPTPLRRFCSVNNPAAVQADQGQSSAYMINRPSTMYETSFVNLDSNAGASGSADSSPMSTSAISNREEAGSSFAPVNYATKSLDRDPKPVFKAPPVQNFPENESRPSNTHKWPALSITQHRPVSISSFPQQNAVGGRSGPTTQGPGLTGREASVDRSINMGRPISPTPSMGRPISPTPSMGRPISPTPSMGRPISPQPPEKRSFVRAQTERLTSPPPEQPVPKPAPGPAKFKRDSRATSVEKITRLLERKSVPRDLSVPPPPKSPEPLERPCSPQESRPGTPKGSPSGSKLVKPKFIQSLEKKWGKLTNNKSEECSSSGCTGNSSPPDEAQAQPNESMLLQRALSPEKKPKSKFGASTVNFMLGKFRKIEESSSGPNVAKVPVGKPPTGTGRRIQAAYAGACSDSVVTLPQHRNYAERPPKVEFPAEPLRDDSRAGSDATLVDVPVAPEPEPKKPRRPLSLGIFSKNSESSKSASFIPRFGKSAPQEQPAQPVPEISVEPESGPPEPLTPTDPDSLESPTSASSGKTEVSVRSVLDDPEESVSDRIFRKSFYSRFNSLDRKKYGQTVSGTASGIRHYSPNRSLTSSLILTAPPAADGRLSPGASRQINKYNPNPLFKELITEEFKSGAGNKTDYSRRVTSKLSKLLREIESDVKIANNVENIRNSITTANGRGGPNGGSPNPKADLDLTDEND